jgi:hypothetical protein
MSKRHKSNNSGVRLPQTLTQADELMQKLAIHKSLMYQKLMESNKPDDIMKALKYQQDVQKTGGGVDPQKAYLYAPDNEFYNGMGYKTALKVVPFEFLRSMGGTPIIFSVISTRINQILDYGTFSTDMDKPGWTIRKRLGRFETEYENTDQDKRAIEKIVDFLENGGLDAKFTIHNDFHDFLKVFPKDLLELDQGCFEIQRTRGGDPLSYDTVDGATVRLLETIDPNYDQANGKYELLNFKGHEYLPYYCQVWRERVLRNPRTKQEVIWYPWEMCFAARNKTSNIMQNGYGQSELEVLMRVVTWLLESMEYNGRFFTNGSNPRGFFTMKGGVDPKMLNDFRMAWRSMVSGWQNAHKVPVFEAEKIEWVDMHHTNKEMEFSQWMEFLILVTCSVFKIDPSELGFRFKQQSSIFGESGQKQRQEHSKDKGLKPLLKVIQKNIDKFLVSELNSNYQFVFTGVDVEDETIKLDNDVKKLANGMVSMEDKFKEYTGREFDPNKDTILNTVYQQSKMQAQYGGAGMNGLVDNTSGGQDVGQQNPFDMFEKDMIKGESSDPITNELIKYINTELVAK